VSFLLDTNVLSEPTKPRPNPGVLDWLGAADEDRLFVSVASLAELHFGVARLPVGKRRLRLFEWLVEELAERFRGRILPIDEQVAADWGRIVAQESLAGRVVGAMDAFIAATARAHELTLVTHNLRDFEQILPRIVNPWSG
jgi:predicted nucleic acid-binding protein